MKNIEKKLIKGEIYYVKAKRFDSADAPIDDSYGIFKEIVDKNAYFITRNEKIGEGGYRTWCSELKDIIGLKKLNKREIVSILNDASYVKSEIIEKLKNLNIK